MRHVVLGTLAAFFLLGAATTTNAEEAGGGRASALVTLHFAPASCAVVWPEVKAIFEGSPREGWDQKLPAVLAESPRTLFDIECEREDTDDGGVLAFRVTVELKGPAVGVLRATDVLGAQIRRLDRHLKQQLAAERQARAAESLTLAQRQQVLIEKIGALSPEGALPWPLSTATFFETLLQRRNDLKNRLLDLDVEQKTLDARRAVFQQRWTELSAGDAFERQAQSKTWSTIVQARERVLDEERALLEQGKGHPIDVAAAVESLARVLLERAEALADPNASPTRARLVALRALITDVDADLAALGASRTRLGELAKLLDVQIQERKKGLLVTTRAEEELRVLGDRVLDLQQSDLASPPRISVIPLG